MLNRDRSGWLRPHSAKLVGCVLLLFAAWAAPAGAADAPGQGETEQVAALVQEIRRRPPAEAWAPVSALLRRAQKPEAGIPYLFESLLKDSDEKMRLAAAHGLCQLGQAESGLRVLRQLAAQSKSVEVRRAAVAAIAASPVPDDDLATPEALKKLLRKETDPQARLECARALHRLSYRTEARRVLGELLAQAPEAPLREEVLLTLAEQGALLPPAEWPSQPDPGLCETVHEALAGLRFEPTPNGRRAAALFQAMQESTVRSTDPQIAAGERLVREILQRIQQAYPDAGKSAPPRLFENACRGLVSSLDPFSQYLDHDEVQATQDMLRQDYGGIGAYVGLRPQGFVILQPIYNGPAYRAGLRSLDTILEVDGQKATEVIARDGLSRVITKLKGKPGSTVRVKFFRRGFSKPVEADITRERVRVESALWARLPGELGYVRLTRFGERTPSELDRALDELVKKGRAKGLVLDLRDDPGGLLKSAVETADRFLSAGKLIVYSAGRPEFAPRKDFTAGGGPEDEALPMVVLVNAGTASGSEIVAGALQAQKRALLVGEKTFGKGSVQQIMPLRATSGETHLRLTVAKYFLPDGRCIHEQGVEPDVAAGPAEQDEFVLRALAALRRKHVFEDYVRANWAAHKDTFLKLAESDGGSAAAYPGLVGLHEGLGQTGLSLDDVRVEVRQVARKLAQDELRREFACDLEGDEVLQRGILELLRKLNVQPASIAQYKDYPERFKDVAAEGALTALPATPPEANHTEP